MDDTFKGLGHFFAIADLILSLAVLIIGVVLTIVFAFSNVTTALSIFISTIAISISLAITGVLLMSFISIPERLEELNDNLNEVKEIQRTMAQVMYKDYKNKNQKEI